MQFLGAPLLGAEVGTVLECCEVEAWDPRGLEKVTKAPVYLTVGPYAREEQVSVMSCPHQGILCMLVGSQSLPMRCLTHCTILDHHASE